MAVKNKSSIMWKYINQTQSVLKDVLTNNYEWVKNLIDVKRIFIVGHGSSYNAAVTVRTLVKGFMDIPIYCYIPEEFAYEFKDNLNKDDLLIMISQTGTSKGVLDATQSLLEQVTSIAVTADLDSPLALKSNYVIDLKCGEEISNAKTKGFSSTIVSLLLFMVQFSVTNGLISKNIHESILKELSFSIENIDEFTTIAEESLDSIVKDVGYDLICFIGNYEDRGLLQEGMLKTLETTCGPALWTSPEEFSHGIHRSLGNKSFLIVIDQQDSSDHDIRLIDDYFGELCTTLYLGFENIAIPYFDKDKLILPIDKYTKGLIYKTIFIQILSVVLPEKMGLDPNRACNDDLTNVMTTRV